MHISFHEKQNVGSHNFIELVCEVLDQSHSNNGENTEDNVESKLCVEQEFLETCVAFTVQEFKLRPKVISCLNLVKYQLADEMALEHSNANAKACQL